MTKFNQLIITLFFAIIISLIFTSQSTFSNHDICNCKGYKGMEVLVMLKGGPAYAGKVNLAMQGKADRVMLEKVDRCIKVKAVTWLKESEVLVAGKGGPAYAGKGGPAMLKRWTLLRR